MTRPNRRWAAVSIAVAMTLVAACGDDEGDATEPTAEPTEQTAEPTAPTAEPSAEPTEPTGEATADPTEPTAEPTEEAPEATSTADDLAGSEITVYSGRSEDLVQGVIDAFEAETGVTVNVRYGNSAEMGAALLEEGESTPADVFYSQEVGAVGVLAKNDLLAPLPDELVQRADERFRPPEGNLWVGVTGRSRVIVYNPDLVPAVPEGVLELTDPIWEGQVAIVPGNAGFQAFITGFRVTQGEDAARQWLLDMQANGARTDIESNGDVLAAVNDGEVPAGLINHYYWGGLAAELGVENMTAQLVFPSGDDPGGLFNATAAALTKNGADNPAALAFIEYLLSDAGQQYFVDETYEYPVVDGIADPPGYPARSELEGPALDLTDLDSLEDTQALLTELGLLG